MFEQCIKNLNVKVMDCFPANYKKKISKSETFSRKVFSTLINFCKESKFSIVNGGNHVQAPQKRAGKEKTESNISEALNFFPQFLCWFPFSLISKVKEQKKFSIQCQTLWRGF